VIIKEVIYFTHELDLLEAHMEEHKDFVDLFLIKESPVLFTGPEKPLIFSNNIERFSRFPVEVIVIPPEEYDLDVPRSFSTEDHNYQKYFQSRRANRVKSQTYAWDYIRKDCDYILSMDADEIINSQKAHVLLELLETKEYEYISITLRQCQFWVNSSGKKRSLYRVFRSDRDVDLKGGVAVKGRSRTSTPVIGWHFCNCFLDPKDLQTKAKGITTHYGIGGVDNVPSVEEITESLAAETNPFFNKNKIKAKKECNLDEVPKFMKENPDRFPWAPK
jgi:hypothetical protein